MYWAVMRRACESGRRVFDFGRSKVGTGSYAFKMHWGFEPTPLFYENRLLRLDDVPAINPLNPKYALMIATWKRLPLAIANALRSEEHTSELQSLMRSSYAVFCLKKKKQ